jgi:hypothetical protein
MDARSIGTDADPNFVWSEQKFKRLLAYHDRAADAGGGSPVDTLFDAFLMVSYSWKNGTSLWPGQGQCCMNKDDWEDVLHLQIEMGASNLELAAEDLAGELPYPARSSSPLCGEGGGPTPGVVLTIPTPDPRQQSFGAIEEGGRSLNFSIAADRLAATKWYVEEARRRYYQRPVRPLKRAFLLGFYWFTERLDDGDDELIPALRAHIKELDRRLILTWIPYFQAPGTATWLPKWRELGFDFVSLQPNYAFHNTTEKRFDDVRALASQHQLGVELELANYVRNPNVKDWQTSFSSYLDHVSSWKGAIMRAYYNGNVFVNDFAANSSHFSFYTKLYEFVKGTY